ncbi:MAG: L-histidine N(alpha)-methyltransferase [Rubripirellula sp.]
MPTPFESEVLRGLRSNPKQIPCKYFYDQKGSQLFDCICELPEYYPMRTEQSIMDRNIHEIVEQVGPGVMLVEYGSGSSIKTRRLLEHLSDPVAYVPVDISREHLLESAKQIAEDFPDIEVLPVCADFTQEFRLPIARREPTHSAVYFPGSTIGNFVPAKAEEMLARIAPLCGRGGGLLIGVDLQKDVEVLERAYNDSQGVTADFNLNLLHRIRRELDTDLEPGDFRHHSFYNTEKHRIEIYIRSAREQQVRIGTETFFFTEDELIHTEFSHKYTVDEFAEMARRAGLQLRKSWTDEREYFAVLHLITID